MSQDVRTTHDGGGVTPSYANMAMPSETRGVQGPPPHSVICDKNIILVKVKREARDVTFNGENFSQLCEKLKINIERDIEGYQTIFDRGDFLIEIWLKSFIPAINFSNDEAWELGGGLVVLGVHPALSQEVTLLIQGLPFLFPEDELRSYVAKFGGVITPKPPVMGKYTGGPAKGKFSGERRYKADFTGQKRPMGSFHSIKGKDFKVTYRGNTPTCSLCHGTPARCLGGGIARRCCEHNGLKFS